MRYDGDLTLLVKGLAFVRLCCTRLIRTTGLSAWDSSRQGITLSNKPKAPVKPSSRAQISEHHCNTESSRPLKHTRIFHHYPQKYHDKERWNLFNSILSPGISLQTAHVPQPPALCQESGTSTQTKIENCLLISSTSLPLVENSWKLCCRSGVFSIPCSQKQMGFHTILDETKRPLLRMRFLFQAKGSKRP